MNLRLTISRIRAPAASAARAALAVAAMLVATAPAAHATPLTTIDLYAGFEPYVNASDFGVPSGPLLFEYQVSDMILNKGVYPLGMTDFAMVMHIPYYSLAPTEGDFLLAVAGLGTFTVRGVDGVVGPTRIGGVYTLAPIDLTPGYGTIEVRYETQPGMGLWFGTNPEMNAYFGAYKAYAYTDAPPVPDGGATATLVGVALAAMAVVRRWLRLT